MMNMKWLAVAAFVVLVQAPPKIEKGEKAPDFAAKNQKDEEVKLSELLQAKRNVLLAFYPKDFTGG
jgi:peroxiredoxin